MPIIETAPSPTRVSFYMTNRCNMQCPYCFTDKYRRHDMKCPDVSVETVERAFEVFGGFDRAMIGSPGEPTMSPNFPSVVKALVGRVQRLNITTNGSYIQRLGDRVPWKKFHRVNLTVPEIEPDLYFERTGTKFFDEMMWALRFLIDNGIGHTLNFVVDMDGIERVEEYVRFAVDHGVKEMAILPLLQFKDFELDEDFFWSNTLTRDNSDGMRRIEEQRHKTSAIKGRRRMIVSWPNMVSRRVVGRGCKMAFDYIAINGRGDISICCRGEGPRGELGNLRDGKALWTAPVLEEFRRKVLAPEERFEKCKVCHACYELGGGCP